MDAQEYTQPLTEEKKKDYHRLRFSITDLENLSKMDQNVSISKEAYDSLDKAKMKSLLMKGAESTIDKFLERVKTNSHF